jgi:hypothetical protein
VRARRSLHIFWRQLAAIRRLLAATTVGKLPEREKSGALHEIVNIDGLEMCAFRPAPHSIRGYMG